MNITPNTRYRFAKPTDFVNGFVHEVGFEFTTDRDGQGNRTIDMGGVNIGRAIPKYVLETWLADGRIEKVKWTPKIGEKVHYVTETGRVRSGEFTLSDGEMLDFGNIFRTWEEAWSARDRIYKLLEINK